MADMRWVFPSPDPPKMSRGLYVLLGELATALAAATGNFDPGPTTKLSKVISVFRGFEKAGAAAVWLSVLHLGHLPCSSTGPPHLGHFFSIPSSGAVWYFSMRS